MTRILIAGLPPQHVLDLAACKGVDPSLFFPERGGESKQAKAVCATCPVKAACLGWALDNNVKHGIWGGTSERERRRLRAGLPLETRRPAPRATPRKATDLATREPYTCPNGHLVAGDNLYIDRNQRRCRTCHRASARASTARRRARRKAELAAIRAARATVCPHCQWADGHSPRCQKAS